jgi:hypothetical protein
MKTILLDDNLGARLGPQMLEKAIRFVKNKKKFKKTKQIRPKTSLYKEN